MSFSEYLISKKIDSEAFHKGSPDQFEEWKTIYAQMHPASFTARYLFKINAVRRKYQLRTAEPGPASTAAKPKPVIRPKIS